MYDLDVLIHQGEQYLHELDYSQSSFRHYSVDWKRLKAWCGENGIRGYDEGVQNRYFAYAGLDEAGNPNRHLRSVRTSIEMLISLEETGEPPARPARPKYAVPDELIRAISASISNG